MREGGRKGRERVEVRKEEREGGKKEERNNKERGREKKGTCKLIYTMEI